LRNCILLFLNLVLALPLFAERKVFPATHDSVLYENTRADAAGLKRYETLGDVQQDVRVGVLVPLPPRLVNAKLPKDRRYALPATVAFIEKLNHDFRDVTDKNLVVDSAIRPSDVQKRLTRRNRNAAPAQGTRASTHERGTTFDLSRRMKRGEYRWLITRLAYYRARGEILVIEERACVHIFVGKNPCDDLILSDNLLDNLLLSETQGAAGDTPSGSVNVPVVK
jgi:Family of unknown function (DUF5715)